MTSVQMTQDVNDIINELDTLDAIIKIEKDHVVVDRKILFHLDYTLIWDNAFGVIFQKISDLPFYSGIINFYLHNVVPFKTLTTYKLIQIKSDFAS